MPASSPLRNAAPRPGATRSGVSAPPSSGVSGRCSGVNSPEASGAISIARPRTEPPSTLRCGRYPDGAGHNSYPSENKIYLNGADFEAFRHELVAAERTCNAVACELDGWTLVGRLAALAGRWACRPLKFALVTVFAAYVAGRVERYVLPVLRFFSEIPW